MIHIEIDGDGPPLVMLHGWAMHGEVFAPLSQRLRARRTLYRVDLPGHGRSRGSAITLADTLDHLLPRLPPAPWLGWSLGGLIALQAARRAPAQVSGLIALCASPRFVRADDWPHGVEAEVFHRFAQDLGEDHARTIDRFLALEAHGSEHLRDDLRVLRERVFQHGEPTAPTLLDGLHQLQTGDLRAALPTLQTPALWLAGRRDRLVPWQAMQQAAHTMPNGRFLCFNSGHAPFLSHADAVATAVLDFLDQDLPVG